MEESIENNLSNDDANITRYISTILLSSITYTLIALSTNIQITEILDLELPLLVVLSLIITYFSLNGYKKIIYIIFIALTIVTLIRTPQYSFFIMIALFSELVVEILIKIFNNKDDYQINK
ncbi:MAG: hypothetical protein E7Z86_00965 [Methanosphaera stadtmanae]|jgi:hypothetical protein|nr:hypothetical protein [Methanosphaera stadtmanae]